MGRLLLLFGWLVLRLTRNVTYSACTGDSALPAALLRV